MASRAPKPKTIDVDLQYYPGHEALLKKGDYQRVGTAARVAAFSGKVPLGDFLNYALISRSDGVIFESYAARNRMIHVIATWFKDILPTAPTVNWRPGSKREQERVGEALSLAVMSNLFGVTAADWGVIPITRVTSFDFERTFIGISAQDEVIQVEAKGSFVSSNVSPTPADKQKIDRHAKNITKKKLAISKKGAKYPLPATVRYGFIASIDPSSTAKCYLLDPPADQQQGDPRRIRVANRLEHLAYFVSLLAPEAQLPKVLVERAAEWRKPGANEPTGVLHSASGHAFTAGKYVEDFLSRGKIYLEREDIVGDVWKMQDVGPVFIGIRGDVIRTAILGNPDKILGLEYQAAAESVLLVQSEQAAPLQSPMLTLYGASSGIVIGMGRQIDDAS